LTSAALAKKVAYEGCFVILPFNGGENTKYFNKKPCYEISPATGFPRQSITSSLVLQLPSKSISLVTEASEVISLPLTTPAASISRLVSYKPISTLPP